MSERADTTRRGGSRTSLEDRRGFALPVVLLLLMVLSTITVFFLISSSDQQRAGRAMRESAHSFYAADAGVNMVLAQWDSLQYDTLVAAPGDSVDLGWVTMDGGATYRAKIFRVDGSQGMPFYSLSVTGVGPPPFGGQRTIFVELYGTGGGLICCSSAVTGGAAGGEADVSGSVSGLDTNPPGWGSVCTEPLVDKPGVTWKTNDISGSPVGDPPEVIDPTMTMGNLFNFGGMDYDDLAAMADIILSGGEPSGIGPSESPPGTCDTSDQWNWGDPFNPTGVCGDYFPIIHVTGDLRPSDGTQYGQGILLVDGELRIEDDFDFYGIIIAGAKNPARARFSDAVTIHGAIISAEEFRFEAALMQYSSCAVRRALEGAGLGGSGEIEPLDERAWRQVMD